MLDLLQKQYNLRSEERKVQRVNRKPRKLDNNVQVIVKLLPSYKEKAVELEDVVKLSFLYLGLSRDQIAPQLLHPEDCFLTGSEHARTIKKALKSRIPVTEQGPNVITFLKKYAKLFSRKGKKLIGLTKYDEAALNSVRSKLALKINKNQVAFRIGKLSDVNLESLLTNAVNKLSNIAAKITIKFTQGKPHVIWNKMKDERSNR